MSENKNQSLSVRMTPEMKDRIRRMARTRGMTISDFAVLVLESSPLLAGDEINPKAELPKDTDSTTTAELRMASIIDQLVEIIDDFAGGKIPLNAGVRPRLTRLADHIRTGKIS